MVCAARALAELATQKAAAAAAARAEAANPTYFPSHEGATAMRLSDAPGGAGASRGGGRSKAIAAAVSAAAAAAAVPVSRLRDVFSTLCREQLASPLAASEFNDLVDRLVVRGGKSGGASTGTLPSSPQPIECRPASSLSPRRL